MKTYTSNELESLTLSQLVMAYNEFSRYLRSKPIKKFRDKRVGQKRVWEVMTKAITKYEEDQIKPPKRKKITISSLCRDMILNGADNAAIFQELQERYGEERFGPDKRHYPAWYRCELRRKGELPPAFDPINQDPNAIHKFED